MYWWCIDSNVDFSSSGDAVTAVILSAFYVHGLRPGPLLFTETPEMFSVILAGGFIGV